MTEARLVAITKPVIDNIPSANDFIAYAARVSNPANQMNAETGPKLLAYCQRKRHWSVFEMAHMVIEVKTTRAIAHQVIRHRTFSFQEFSQRYAAVQEPFLISDARLQNITNRQSSFPVASDSPLAIWWEDAQKKVADLTASVYAEGLQRGLAKEQARNVLPEGMTPTTFYMAGTIRSWIHFCSGAKIHPAAADGELLGVRAEEATQQEHRQIALLCQNILYREFPALVPEAP